jgi:SAM-dependent methyltransferase
MSRPDAGEVSGHGEGTLTEQSFWDEYWDSVVLPVEHRMEPGNTYGNAILGVFDRYLPKDASLSAAELGGSPGPYLAYIHKSLGYQVTCIDYSAVGCRKTIENFRLLGVSGEVIEADIFSNVPDTEFDVVYSLGLIEHFEDRIPVVQRHVRLVKPGGYLVLGVPNFQGIHGWFMRKLAPKLYAAHEIDAMDLRNWREFEVKFGLETIFKGYVGGFEPLIFKRREEKRIGTLLPFAVAFGLTAVVHRLVGFVRRFNGRRISGYAMAVYRLPREGQANR